jgi:hypothetical protein
MNTQTFSKVFLSPNNKKKNRKQFFLLPMGRPMETNRPDAVFGPNARAWEKGEPARLGLRPKAVSAP